MKTLPQFKKSLSFVFATTALINLSACNMLAFMDKPSGDVQLLDAARSCLDKGDYSCALEYYQQLSGFVDEKISETSLTNLANSNIFKMSDLIESLGSGTGGTSSFSFLAETLATRGKTTSADRLTIQKAYADAANIQDSTLKSYMQFISALIMTNHLLASAVGADGKLTASDIVSSPTACNTSTCVGAGEIAKCEKPSSSSLLDKLGSDAGILGTASNWDTDPSIEKVIQAAIAANDASTILFSSGNTSTGLGDVFNTLSNAGANDCFKRRAIISALSLQ
jgi:hypothetical protein